MSVLPKNIDVSAIRFNDVRTLEGAGGAKMVNMTYKGGRFFMQSALMPIDYGLNDSYALDDKLNKPHDGPRKFTLSLSFRDNKANPAVQRLQDKLQEVQEAVIDAAYKNRLAWFKSDCKNMREIVEAKFSPIVKLAMDRETKMPSTTLPPSMRVKLPYDEKNDAFNFVCKDLQNQVMEFKDVKDNLSNTSARILFQFTGVWITSAGFGCMLKATEVHLDTIKVVNAPAMEVDSDDEGPTATDADLVADVLHAAAPAPAKKPAAPVAAPVAPAKKAAPAPPVMLSDSEEESEAEEEEPAAAPEPEESEEAEEEEEEEREPTPPPPPPKKVVKKTVAKK